VKKEMGDTQGALTYIFSPAWDGSGPRELCTILLRGGVQKALGIPQMPEDDLELGEGMFSLSP
jgi:hypothetical protein